MPNKSPVKSAVILFSGGLDSTTVMAIVKDKGFDITALSFDYGQRHSIELDKAKQIAANYGVKEHIIINMNMNNIGGSALTDKSIDVPVYNKKNDITITYVPARNLIFLSVATALAEARNINYVFAGMNALDYSGYPDCRPEFISSFRKTANLATRIGVETAGIKIMTPLMKLTKADIIKKGLELGVDYSLTHSCYNPDENGNACGKCDSCELRRRGFAFVGIPDPALKERMKNEQ